VTLRSELTADELKAECTPLERAVLSAGLATEEYLSGHRPGGAENLSEDIFGWLRFYAVLHRAHARGEDTPASAIHARNDATVLDALRNEPILVRALDKTQDDIYVYPKGLDALLHVHALDIQLAWMLTQKELLEMEGSAKSLNLIQYVMDAVAYTYQLLCWVVTTEGPEMPYKVEDDDPEVPPHIRAMSPWDVVRICQAHQEHLARLGVLSSLLDVKSHRENGKRPSWSMFIGTMSIEMGESANTLMRHRSLAELLAVARIHAAANEVPDKETADATS
jgi:hypothetical protein